MAFFFTEPTNSTILLDQALGKTLPICMRYDSGRNLFPIPVLGRRKNKQTNKKKPRWVRESRAQIILKARKKRGPRPRIQKSWFIL